MRIIFDNYEIDVILHNNRLYNGYKYLRRNHLRHARCHLQRLPLRHRPITTPLALHWLTKYSIVQSYSLSIDTICSELGSICVQPLSKIVNRATMVFMKIIQDHSGISYKRRPGVNIKNVPKRLSRLCYVYFAKG